MSFNGNNPSPQFLDLQIKDFLDFQKQDRKRHYKKRDILPKMFAQARDSLIGTNDMRLIQNVANGAINNSIQGKPKPFKLDISGWDFNNKKFREAVSEINASHSIIFDVVMASLDKLDEAQNIKSLRNMPTITNAGNPNMMLEDPGMIERLKGSTGSVFKPRWQKQKENAYGMVNDLFAYMKDSRIKWESYLSTHWDNTSKAVDWQQDSNVYEFLEELEALDDCEMRTMILIDAGMRVIQRENMKQANITLRDMLTAKTASQASMLPNVSGPPIIYQQSQPQVQRQTAPALALQEQDFQ